MKPCQGGAVALYPPQEPAIVSANPTRLWSFAIVFLFWYVIPKDNLATLL
jgi:hypothetical protein